MHQASRTARVAGALYLLVALMAPFHLIYVPNTVIVPGDATATAHKILASEGLFRAGIVSNLAALTIFIFLVVTLYRLLNGVNKTHAVLMVILFLVSVPISLFNVMSQHAALTLFRGPEFLSVFDQSQREALGMLFLGLRRSGLVVAQIFWGLWLFPFGLLVMRSRFLPRILGVLLLANGLAYLAVSLTSLLLPPYAPVVGRFAIVAEFGELWVALWLLIKGVKVQALPAEELSRASS